MRRVTSLALRMLTLASLVVGGSLGGSPPVAYAGCGCQKLPPPPASVRPAAAPAGTPLTLFHPALVSGRAYSVRLTSGTTGESVVVEVTALTRRDLGDGLYKAQLLVPVPPLPLGPTSITVSEAGQSGALLALGDEALTITPAPIVVPTQLGEYRYQDYQAAVSREGVVYISLDLRGVTLPRTFRAQPQGYPLRFSSEEVVIYNTQGFLMQLLDQRIPGLFTLTAPNAAEDGEVLQYSRHEFSTFFLQHGERAVHAVDPSDPNWHLDGTRHIDHDALIVAIRGTLTGGRLPTPGATPPFTLVLNTYSLFTHGLVGANSIKMSSLAQTDSYNSRTGVPGVQGDVRTNGPLTMSGLSIVKGNATAASFSLSGGSLITGTQTVSTQPLQFMPIAVPSNLPDLGSITLSSGQVRTLVGPASYKVTNITLNDLGQLLIDNTQGPVTLYVSGTVTVSGLGNITVLDPSPEKFALYVTGNGQVKFSNAGMFYGVVYAPNSTITLSSAADFRGAFVGAAVDAKSAARIHYDTALRGQ